MLVYSYIYKPNRCLFSESWVAVSKIRDTVIGESLFRGLAGNHQRKHSSCKKHNKINTSFLRILYTGETPLGVP